MGPFVPLPGHPSRLLEIGPITVAIDLEPSVMRSNERLQPLIGFRTHRHFPNFSAFTLYLDTSLQLTSNTISTKPSKLLMFNQTHFFNPRPRLTLHRSSQGMRIALHSGDKAIRITIRTTHLCPGA